MRRDSLIATLLIACFGVACCVQRKQRASAAAAHENAGTMVKRHEEELRRDHEEQATMTRIGRVLAAEERILAGIAVQAGVAIDNAQLYRQAREARAAAEAASRSKDEFLATVSHELRTPLNAVLGWAQILQISEDPEKLRRGLGIIVRNAKLQTQLIDDLLDVSRIISGKMRLDVRAVDLPLVVDAAVEAIQPAAEAKKISLVRLLDPQAGPVAGDAERLQQVVWNLLANAVKFTPGAGAPRSAWSASARRSRSWWRTPEWALDRSCPRSSTRHRPPPDRAARRHGGGAEPRRGTGDDVHRPACRSRLADRVRLSRQIEVALAQAPDRVSPERDLHAPPGEEDVRVVPRGLGHRAQPVDERQRLGEILELVLLLEVMLVDEGPAVELAIELAELLPLEG